MKRADPSTPRPPEPTELGRSHPPGVGDPNTEVADFLALADAALVADEATSMVERAPDIVQRCLRDRTYVHHPEHEREITAWCVDNNAIATLECLLRRFALLNARQGLPPPQLHIVECAHGEVIADALAAAQRAGASSIFLARCDILTSADGYESDDTDDTAAVAVAAAMDWAVEVTLHDCGVFSVENLTLILERAGGSTSLSSLTLSRLPAFDDTCMSALATAVLTTGIQQLTLCELTMTDGDTLAQAVCNSGVSNLTLVNCQFEGTLNLLESTARLGDTEPMPLTNLRIDGVTYRAPQTEADMVSDAQNIAQLTMQLNARFADRLSATCRFVRASPPASLGNAAPAPLGMVLYPQAPDAALTLQPVFRCRWNMDLVQSRDFMLRFSRQFRVFLQSSVHGARIEVGPAPVKLRPGRDPYIALASVEVSLTILHHVASDNDGRSLLALRALTRGSRNEWDGSHACLQIKQALLQNDPADALARINQLTEQGVVVPDQDLQEWLDSTDDEQVFVAVATLISSQSAHVVNADL